MKLLILILLALAVLVFAVVKQQEQDLRMIELRDQAARQVDARKFEKSSVPILQKPTP